MTLYEFVTSFCREFCKAITALHDSNCATWTICKRTVQISYEQQQSQADSSDDERKRKILRGIFSYNEAKKGSTKQLEQLQMR